MIGGSLASSMFTDVVAVSGSLPYALFGASWTIVMLMFWVALAMAAVYGGRTWRRIRNAVWLGKLPGGVGALPTEQRPSHDPPRGHKVARLVADPVTGEAGFLGLTLGGTYSRDDVAMCEVLAGRLAPPRRWWRRRSPTPHDAPDLSCTCGFHAFRDPRDAVELLATRPPVSRMFGPVLVEVDLAGTVIEFEQGYRASHQRVLGVQVPRWCLPCARLGHVRRAVRIAGMSGATLEQACRSDLPHQPPLYRFAMAAHHAEVVRRLDGCAALRPVCDDHTPEASCPSPAVDIVVLELADLAAGLGTEVRWMDEGSFAVATYVEAVSWPPPPRGSLAV